MKTLYTYPASFRPFGFNNDYFYTVNPGIPIPLAVIEIRDILVCANEILTGCIYDGLQPNEEPQGEAKQIEVASELLQDAKDCIQEISDGKMDVSQIDGVGAAISIFQDFIHSISDEAVVMGVGMLLDMAKALTRSISESCKAEAA